MIVEGDTFKNIRIMNLITMLKNEEYAKALQLIRGGANVNVCTSNKTTPLHICGNVKVTKALIKAGANLNAQDNHGMTPLASCALLLGEYRDIILVLIRAGADVKIPDNYGNTILHSAAWECDTTLANLLIKNGADPNAVNKDGETPADIANNVFQSFCKAVSQDPSGG